MNRFSYITLDRKMTFHIFLEEVVEKNQEKLKN